jgi:hypothetical protein
MAFSIGLYFDFSAYSDMAIGLARMVGLRLPYNFDSPYQAVSIVDFWRRWHMTLSRFLRDYLYIPLGGNRLGPVRRSVNLMITMLLGGLWHGAAWTFIAWGALHGAYLLINHAWSTRRVREDGSTRYQLPTWVARSLTLLVVMVAWTFFAAPDFASAWAVLSGMSGASGLMSAEAARLILPGSLVTTVTGVPVQGDLPGLDLAKGLVALTLGTGIALFAPNSQQFIDSMRRDDDVPSHPSRWRFVPSARSGAVAAAGFVLALMLMADVKEFAYFQF